jgi:hypothetical protein
MDALTLAIFTIIGGAIGGFIAVFYNSYSTFRQEKALVLLFVQEFMLLFKRCTMYYEQMLKGSVSFSTLYEATDSGTLEKLAEIISDHNILKTIIKIKADFFQVIRWAHRSSRPDEIDAEAQSKAVVFFMGDAKIPDGSYGRNRYKDYRENIFQVLEYLEHLNKKRNLANLFEYLKSIITGESKKLDEYINNCKEDLESNQKTLDHLRIQEKEILINKGQTFVDKDGSVNYV